LSEGVQAFTRLVEKMSQKLETVPTPEAQPAPPTEKRPRVFSRKRATAKRAHVEKATVKPAPPVVEEPAKKPARVRRAKPGGGRGATILQTVQNAVESNPGIDVKTLTEKTGYNTRQLQNTIFRLKKLGKIRAEERGVYFPASPAKSEQQAEDQPVREPEPAEV
jgi:hypothetical protein